MGDVTSCLASRFVDERPIAGIRSRFPTSNPDSHPGCLETRVVLRPVSVGSKTDSETGAETGVHLAGSAVAELGTLVETG